MPRFMPRRAGPTVAVLLALVGLAGCSTNKGPEPGCPTVSFVTGLDRVTVFREGPTRDLTDIRFDAKFDNLAAVCNFEKKGVAVETSFQIVASRGPADTAGVAKLAYFVAVADQTGQVIAKQVFDSELPFQGNLRRVGTTEEMVNTIPYPENPQILKGYRVMIGFQMTPEQLDFNLRQQ